MANSDLIYESLLPWLRGISGLPKELLFLGRRFQITKEGIEQLSGPEIAVNGKSVLIWYVVTASSEGPDFSFASLLSFSHGIFSSQNSGWQNKGSSGLNRESFRENAGRIGAEYYKEIPYGEAWLLFAFPNLPVLLTFTEEDEEYPAMVDIKFGSNATEILPFETLAVLDGLIASEF